MHEQKLQVEKRSHKAYHSGLEVRWCPGCGDYAVLASLQKALAEMEAKPQEHVFISGIGCASRLPYYMQAYGFHTIHGRAPTIAQGLKMMRPDVHVWVIMGDGDALSIGAHHLMHALRRNVNVTYLMLNNQVYGLTKGQYSPTSAPGQLSKTTPQGVWERPVQPWAFALAAGAGFIGRGIDVDPRLVDLLIQAHQHPGASFVEIYQNCHVFNDGAFASFADRSVRQHHTVALHPGEPILFGEEGAWKTLQITPQGIEKITIKTVEEATLYDPHAQPLWAMALAHYPLDPSCVPMGILQARVEPMPPALEQKTLNRAQFLAHMHQRHTWAYR